MIPELGTFSTILALCLALMLAVVPLTGTYTGNKLWIDYARPLAKGVFFFLTLAMLLLAYSFQLDDFSVVYVAHSSNINLPGITRSARSGVAMKDHCCCGCGYNPSGPWL